MSTTAGRCILGSVGTVQSSSLVYCLDSLERKGLPRVLQAVML